MLAALLCCVTARCVGSLHRGKVLGAGKYDGGLDNAGTAITQEASSKSPAQDGEQRRAYSLRGHRMDYLKRKLPPSNKELKGLADDPHSL